MSTPLSSIIVQGYLTNPFGPILVGTMGYYSLSRIGEYVTTIQDILDTSASGFNIGEYFPRWMDIHFNTHASTGSLLRRFFAGTQIEFLVGKYFLSKLEKSKLFNPWLGELRKGWTCSSDLPEEDHLTVTLYSTNLQFSPKRATTEYDFYCSIEPCYIILNNRDLYFKNLHYTLTTEVMTGTVTLAHDILSDGDIFYGTSAGEWEIVEAGSANIDYSSRTVTLDATGTYLVYYPSEMLSTELASAYVCINDGPRIPLITMDFWNSVDELGLLCNLDRLQDETNYEYYQRLKTTFPFRGSTTEEGLQKSLSRELGTISLGYWDGEATLNFAASSLIKNFWAHDLPYQDFEKQDFLFKQDSFFYGERGTWSAPYYVQHRDTTITVVASGGKAWPGYSIQESIRADYKVVNYTKTSSGDFITSISRNSNTIPETYEIAWTRGVEVNSMTKRDYKYTSLLTASGLATQTLLSLKEPIRQKSNTLLGYVLWNKAHWFLTEEPRVQLDYIPIAMDQN